MASSFYETDRAAAEYLLFHFGTIGQISPPAMVKLALNFPVRCVSECLAPGRLPGRARALDLGCAVGRATFELARTCAEVVGIDYSKRFISTARRLRQTGLCPFDCIEEGALSKRCVAKVDSAIDRQRVTFETGDATHLRPGLGKFEVVLMANLIDRLSDPRKCLSQLPALLNSGGRLIITSPYTWLPEYTPRKNWLGGFVRAGKKVRTLETLTDILSVDFKLWRRRDLPFLIREHTRKFQLSIAEASVWLRK